MENSTVKIKLNDKQYSEVLWALEIAQCFYKMEWVEGFTRLFPRAFTQSSTPFANDWKKHATQFQNLFNYSTSHPILKKDGEVLDKIIDEWKREGANEIGDEKNIEMEFENEFKWNVFANALDVVIRVWLGQWEELEEVAPVCRNCNSPNIPFSITREIDVWRKKIVPYYSQCNISGGASFGIYSKELQGEIRIIYDFYKVMMYEMGLGGCYSYQPRVTAGDGYPSPSIIFPYTSTIHVGELTNDEYQRIYQWSNQQDNCGSSLPVKSAIYDSEERRMYMPVEEYRAMLVEKGDIIHRKRNQYYVLEKRGK